jgi:hypothetical protein
MQHLAAEEAAEAAVVCRRSARAEDLGPAARIRARAARRRGRVARRRGRVAPRTTVVLVAPVDRVDPADLGTSGDLAVPATSVGLADRAVQVTIAAPADRVVQVTIAAPADRVVPETTADPADRADPVTTADRVVPVTTADPETSADPADQATSDSGRPTPSEASTVSRGAMEQRRGAGEHPRVPGGAGRSLPRAEYGTRGRSTIGASRNNRHGIGTKTVGASGSSESGSRCKEPAG